MDEGAFYVVFLEPLETTAKCVSNFTFTLPSNTKKDKLYFIDVLKYTG